MDKIARELVRKLKRGKVVGSYPCAQATAELLYTAVSTTRWKNAKDLIEEIKFLGDLLTDAKPEELVIGNILKRVLFIVRDEYSNLKEMATEEQKQKRPGGGIVDILEERQEETYDQNHASLKTNILEGITELMDEIKTSYENVSEQAIDHIHANEVIMTFGLSRTVEAFLKEAFGKGKKRNFQCIVAEAAPGCGGREMAKILAEEGIETTLIPDSAIYAMMARVNKVIVGTHSVMANGGLLALAGTNLLAQAAHYHSVPVMICTALYKLCPIYPADHDLELRSPSEIIPFEEVAGPMADVTVINPAWDYVPPELVSLYITNSGGHNPTYIYRLLSEFYHPDDNE
uniref:Translation initiation factor eIF2B subunit beta n=1 Tax=Arcella intermedia TaxID=1963864 RepID=A0A6B2L8X3_9EUKA